MSLLAGLSLILGLTFLTVVVLYLFEYTKEFPMALVGVMMIGDLLVAGAWYYIGVEFITDVPKFKLGISIAFAVMSFARALTFFVQGKKKGWI